MKSMAAPQGCSTRIVHYELEAATLIQSSYCTRYSLRKHCVISILAWNTLSPVCPKRTELENAKYELYIKNVKCGIAMSIILLQNIKAHTCMSRFCPWNWRQEWRRKAKNSQLCHIIALYILIARALIAHVRDANTNTCTWRRCHIRVLLYVHVPPVHDDVTVRDVALMLWIVLLFTPLDASVLEPDLDLCFTEVQRRCQIIPVFDDVSIQVCIVPIDCDNRYKYTNNVNSGLNYMSYV